MKTFALVPAGWMSSDIEVLREGRPFARLFFGSLTQAGRMVLQGKEYQIRKQGVFSHALHLQSGSTQLCATNFDGSWNQTAEFACDGASYTMTWRAVGGKAILMRDGVEAGTIDTSQDFKSRSGAELADDLSPVACAFALWLTVYKRNNDSALVALMAAG